MKTMKLLAAFAAAATLAHAGSAQAAQLLFNFKHAVPENSFSFSLDSDPIPDASNAGQFVFFDVSITTSTGVILSQVDFFGGRWGGFNVGTVASYVIYRGPVLFSGPPASPHFLTGTFDLAGTGGAGTLTISELSSAIPEPATWALMIAGFGLTGAALRRRNLRIA